ncbi:MAG: hypothetical protein KC589_03515 [Nanoarchaeota archaeon]|nr:hypothetical protein [Nanoarchaeota archaeon]
MYKLNSKIKVLSYISLLYFSSPIYSQEQIPNVNPQLKIDLNEIQQTISPQNLETIIQNETQQQPIIDSKKKKKELEGPTNLTLPQNYNPENKTIDLFPAKPIENNSPNYTTNTPGIQINDSTKLHINLENTRDPGKNIEEKKGEIRIETSF